MELLWLTRMTLNGVRELYGDYTPVQKNGDYTPVQKNGRGIRLCESGLERLAGELSKLCFLPYYGWSLMSTKRKRRADTRKRRADTRREVQ